MRSGIAVSPSLSSSWRSCFYQPLQFVLLAVREAARKEKKQQVTDLFHPVSEELLLQSFEQLKRQSAPGCDGMTWERYAENAPSHLVDLHGRLQRGQYRPMPARRGLIPKEDGTERSLSRFIQHRVRDKRILRLIKQWITVGVVDEHGHRQQSHCGVPQGAVCSPLLANIYLHYSVDHWLNKCRQNAQGDVVIVRYADDAVLGFQKHKDARECLAALHQRLEQFGLKVHPEKTRLVRFGRLALKQYEERPDRGKPGTFDFLGFTHYIGRLHTGKDAVMRKTKRKRQIAQLKRVKQELRKRLHDRPAETGRWLRRVVQGHINYYGVPFNHRAISQFVEEVKRLWLKALRRRSQRHSMTWERFKPLCERWVPKPRVVHPYPLQRFYAKHPR